MTQELPGGRHGNISILLRLSQDHSGKHAARERVTSGRTLLRPRYGCGFSDELLHRLRRRNSPLYPVCGALETTSHLLSKIRTYDKPPKHFAKALAIHQFNDQDGDQLIFPLGSRYS